MYRSRSRQQVLYGHFREFLEIAEELNALSRERGWAESSLWVPTTGTVNEIIWESEYPDLATLQQEDEAFSADAEAMNLVRRLWEHVVQGSVQTELLEQAPRQIA
jgi:hypothetical protein